jgi:hypothetical protein
MVVSSQITYKKDYPPRQHEFHGYRVHTSKPHISYSENNYGYNHVYPLRENEPTWVPKNWPKFVVFFVRMRKMLHVWKDYQLLILNNWFIYKRGVEELCIYLDISSLPDTNKKKFIWNMSLFLQQFNFLNDCSRLFVVIYTILCTLHRSKLIFEESIENCWIFKSWMCCRESATIQQWRDLTRNF